MLPPPPLQLGSSPRRVIVFSGHIVDAVDRPDERFPARVVPQAAQRIDAAMDAIKAGTDDLAITQGSAGGDILFIESCLARHVPVQLILPVPEEEFVERSIAQMTDGDDWKRRYLATRACIPAVPAVMPRAPGNVFERCNRWMLATANASGASSVELLCLWNGAPGDAGGTAHMVDAFRAAHCKITWIDTRDLS